MEKGKVISLEERVPKIKQPRRRKVNRKLILLLFLFFSLIVLVVYFQSPLSHVKTVDVKGNEFYSNDEIVRQSNVSKKTSIWRVDEKTISEKLKELPLIKSVKVDIQLPNTVVFKVREYERMAYVAKGDSFFPVLENGRLLEGEKLNELSLNSLILFNFDKKEMLNETVNELRKLPEEVLNSISETHYNPQETDKYHLTFYMNDGFEVSATLRKFSEKLSHYAAIKGQLDPNKKGIIDLEVGSFFKEYGLIEEEIAEEEDEKEKDTEKKKSEEEETGKKKEKVGEDTEDEAEKEEEGGVTEEEEAEKKIEEEGENENER
ncbi:FtsQ-type POTRA domain-containing protein [Bacillus aquiflavi]|uniref:cell division protein FtsQ/DivIB n=1 Tax=Bacillus aquiflavi TaxID=2672567 RepID=UPI001CA9CC69|nr:FtsQ-type POTRA domain-containing protein [Bacillus aquiflavi]UAC49308.1 FtsQ-type POTRA domain-containing protein [Bacillus aquiflavi]